jgi:hypothetical protein
LRQTRQTASFDFLKKKKKEEKRERERERERERGSSTESQLYIVFIIYSDSFNIFHLKPGLLFSLLSVILSGL